MRLWKNKEPVRDEIVERVIELLEHEPFAWRHYSLFSVHDSLGVVWERDPQFCISQQFGAKYRVSRHDAKRIEDAFRAGSIKELRLKLGV